MTTTLSKANSGDAVHGSLTYTSMPAPATRPSAIASASACSSTSPPRAALTIRTPGLTIGQFLLADQPDRLRGLRQVDGDEVALPQQFVQADQADPELGRAGRLDVRVVGDQPGAEGGHPLGEQHADPAEPDHADGLALHLDAGVLGPLPLAGLERRRWRWRCCRATASSSAIACSAAETMLEVGALTTMTPAAVAAGTSTLSSPTPARATTFSRGAAAIASASIWVALRTITASASASAASSAGRSVPSTWRTSKSCGEHLDGGGGQFFGDQYDGSHRSS